VPKWERPPRSSEQPSTCLQAGVPFLVPPDPFC